MGGWGGGGRALGWALAPAQMPPPTCHDAINSYHLSHIYNPVEVGKAVSPWVGKSQVFIGAPSTLVSLHLSPLFRQLPHLSDEQAY